MKNIILLLMLLLGLLVMAIHSHAQSNLMIQAYSNGVPVFVPYSPSTASDWSRALSDVGINVDVKTISAYLFLAYFGAKIVRNKTSLGNGAIGQFLSSVVNAEAKTPPKV